MIFPIKSPELIRRFFATEFETCECYYGFEFLE